MSGMSWFYIVFYIVVGAITAYMGLQTARAAGRNEKVFAFGTLFMPLGCLLWALGTDPIAGRNISLAGTGCFFIGAIMYVLMTIRRSRTPS